uniref:MATH domain-containing protein n=1 Tax=Steinernema glaseri TaxID=37863 RepID=A0A1I7Y835_9BILA
MAQLRYTFLPSRYNGLFDKDFPVSHLDECSREAIKKEKIGFRFKLKNEQMSCAFLKKFTRFDSRSDLSDYDFILDTSVGHDGCRWDTVRNGKFV